MRPRKPRRNCLNCGRECARPEKKYCNFSCQQKYARNQFIERWKSGVESGCMVDGSLSGYVRNYLLGKYNYQCSRCGWDEKNIRTGKSPLEIDHMDGNWKNNEESNLVVLCPNCHSLTPTFRSLNNGYGRKHRRAAVA